MRRLILCLAGLTNLAFVFAQSGDTTDVHDYRRIDSLALAAPPAAVLNLTTLATYLAAGARDDAEKARAVFRWVTAHVAYDVQAYRTGRYPDQHAESVFRRRTAVCEGYANLVYELCGRLGLEAAVVRGFAKGAGYRFGDRITKVSGHAWNAVKIDSTWRLMDATWGAGVLNGGQFVRRFSYFFFFPAPAYFILDHYPLDPKWQLQDSPVTLTAFEAGPQPFFSFPFYPIAPLDGSLVKNETYLFRYRIPGAVSVIVIQDGKEATVLARGTGDEFAGEVLVTGAEVQLGARYSEETTNYDILMQYGTK